MAISFNPPSRIIRARSKRRPKTGQTWVRTGSLKATVVVPPNTGQALMMFAETIKIGVIVPERTSTEPSSFPPIEKLAGKAP
jgi:hypothetical protein